MRLDRERVLRRGRGGSRRERRGVNSRRIPGKFKNKMNVLYFRWSTFLPHTHTSTPVVPLLPDVGHLQLLVSGQTKQINDIHGGYEPH